LAQQQTTTPQLNSTPNNQQQIAGMSSQRRADSLKYVVLLMPPNQLLQPLSRPDSCLWNSFGSMGVDGIMKNVASLLFMASFSNFPYVHTSNVASVLGSTTASSKSCSLGVHGDKGKKKHW
jgi:hypothetical protein